MEELEKHEFFIKKEELKLEMRYYFSLPKNKFLCIVIFKEPMYTTSGLFRTVTCKKDDGVFMYSVYGREIQLQPDWFQELVNFCIKEVEKRDRLKLLFRKGG